MNMEVSGDQVLCPSCHKSIVLPHQSPLGIFQGLENQPTGEWPATFLCPVCGQVFSCSDEEIDDAAQTKALGSQIPDLLRVLYVCVQDSYEERKVAYTTCPTGSDPEGERPRLLKRLSGVREILEIEPYPYPYQQ
jgi:hypothetical protein